MPRPTRRTVTFENGETRNDVPPGIDTWESYQRFKTAQIRLGVEDTTEPVEPREAEEYGAFGRDIKRVYQSVIGRPADFLESVAPLNALLNPRATARDLYGEDFYDLKVGDRMQRVQQARAKSVSESESGTSLFNPNLDELDDIFDEDGYVTGTETNRGFALNIGSYVAGGVGIYRGLSRLAAQAPRAFNEFARKHNVSATIVDSIITGTAVDQWISNPNDPNFLSSLKDMGVTDSTLVSIGEYLEAEEDDTALEKRIKMLAGNLPVEIVAGGIIGKLWKDTSVFSATGKRMEDATQEEIGEEALKGLKRTKRELMQPTKTRLTAEPTKNPLYYTIDERGNEIGDVWREVDDLTENAQVFAQEGFFRGLWQKFTQSRGYNVVAGQDAFENAQQAKRKYQNRSEHLASRLNTSILNILRSDSDSSIMDDVYLALTSRKKERLKAFKTLERPELIKFLKQEFNLTDDIAENVIDTRALIDELSTEINKFAPNPQIQKLIANNLNMYMRRSYKLFEDKNYKASDAVKNRAVNFFFDKFKKREASNLKKALNKNKKYTVKSDAELLDEAWNNVDSILFDRSAGRKIFERRKDFAEPIRELMGEVTNPIDSILLTTSKMADHYEKSRFLKDMQRIGTRQKWLFDSKPEGLEGLEILKNTGREELDGMYTTPKMAKVISNDEISIFGEGKINNPLYKNFLSLKGFANKAATVFSWTTNMRNILGGMQFNLVNGLNPIPLGLTTKGENNFFKNFMTIYNDARLNKGDKGLDELYEKYVGLGVINTNVRVGDFRALINEGLEASSVDDFMSKISNKLSRVAEDFYVGTDDFFKINAFNAELNTLKNANKGGGKTLATLEKEAADIVKNTLPNYDRVPPGIKALRNWPLGTFVSFPAEIIRTSYGIARQAGRELLSGNGVLMRRGVQRSAGMFAGGYGINALSNLTSDTLGWTEAEKKSAEIMTETPWSKDSPRLWHKDEETGKIYSADTKYLDAYNTVKEPILAVLNELDNGNVTEEELPKKLYDGIATGLGTLMAPFTTQAIFTKAVTDVWYATQDPEGKTPEGKELFGPATSTEDRIANSGYFILSSLIPGTVDSVDRLISAYDEEPNSFTGDPRFDVGTEWRALLTGIRLTEFNPEQQLNFAISKYKNDNSALQGVFADYSTGMGDLVDQYKSRQQERYEIQKELYRYIKASQYFINDTDIQRQLQDRGISRLDAYELSIGKFIPQTITNDFLSDISYKVGDSPDRLYEIKEKLSSVYSDMSRTLLNTPEEDDD